MRVELVGLPDMYVVLYWLLIVHLIHYEDNAETYTNVRFSFPRANYVFEM